MTTTGSAGPRIGRRRLPAATDIAAVAIVAVGAVLVGISVHEHEHHDHILALRAARQAHIERAAAAEARQPPATARSQARRAGASAKAHEHPTGEVHQLGTAVSPAPRRPRPAQPRSPSDAARGAVSEIGGGPATLVIPALQVRAPVVATGAVDGSMTIPADIHTVGWYDGTDTTGGTTASAPTPWPGQPGVSVLAGHVDWAGEGPGALYYISQLVPGDPVEVIGSNGVRTYWRVSQSPITVAKADLPAALFVNTGPPKLALVTCGGPFDAATGHYRDNVIVWATPALR